MAGNQFGQVFKLITFGESHGEAIGAVVEGCPAGLDIDLNFIQNELTRRRPGQSNISSPRVEADKVEIISGVFEGKSLGSPICLLIRNENHQSKDYDKLKSVYRPSHADFTYEQKYGIRDYRGGGRASARETAARVAGAAIAKLLLQRHGIVIRAFVSQVYDVKLNENWQALDFSQIENNTVRCPHEKTAQKMIAAIEQAKIEGDSLGGKITCIVQNVPIGLGEPVFQKLNAQLAAAMFNIHTVKSFEMGSGIAATFMKGSEHNDEFELRENRITTKTNHSGGIQGGISNGMPIEMEIGFKPVSSILKTQKTLNQNKETIDLSVEGRHDPCVLPRAVPIVEAMAALVLADAFLLNKLSKIDD